METDPTVAGEPDGQEKAKAILELTNKLQDIINTRFDERDNDTAEKLARQIRESLPDAIKALAEENPDFRVPGLGEEKDKEFSFAKAAYAIANKNWANAGYEKECFDEMDARFGNHVARAKALNTGHVATPDAHEGQYLVPEQHLNEIIDLLYADSVVFQSGARSMPGQFGEITIPVLLSSASAAWYYEGVSITESEPSFGEHTMRPRQLMAMVRVGNMLLTNSRPTAEQIIRDNLAEQFRIALDTAVLEGSGVGAEPTGLVNATPPFTEEGTTASVTMTAGWTYAKAMEFITDLANENALRGSLGWVMNPTEWSRAIQMSSGTSGVDVNRIVVQDGAATSLLGYPLRTTTILAHSGASSGAMDDTVIFGDWRQVRVPFWKTLEMRASDVAGTAFAQNQTLVRGILYADVSFDHLQSFSIGSTQYVI